VAKRVNEEDIDAAVKAGLISKKKEENTTTATEDNDIVEVEVPFTAKVQAIGRIVIPESIREVLGIEQGDLVTVTMVVKVKVPKK